MCEEKLVCSDEAWNWLSIMLKQKDFGFIMNAACECGWNNDG